MEDIVVRLRRDADALEDGPYTSIKEAREVMREAADTIEDMRTRFKVLPPEAWDRFMDAIDNPKPAPDALKNLVRDYDPARLKEHVKRLLKKPEIKEALHRNDRKLTTKT